jgi:hypothetical protein
MDQITVNTVKRGLREFSKEDNITGARYGSFESESLSHAQAVFDERWILEVVG